MVALIAGVLWQPVRLISECRADSSVGGDSTAGEDTLAGVVFSNTQAPTSESQGGFFNLEHYVRDHEGRMSTPHRPAGSLPPAEMDAEGARATCTVWKLPSKMTATRPTSSAAKNCQ